MIKIWSKFHIQILWYSFTRDNSFILTPSSYLPGKQENPSSSASSQNVYLFLNSEVINGEIEYRSRELLKAFFCHQKTVRKQTCSAWNFLQPSIQVCRGAYIPYFKISTPFSCCSIFFEDHDPQFRIKKTVNEHTVDYHPSPSELTSRIHPVIFLWTFKGFIFPEFFSIFCSNLYIPPWLRKSFKFISLSLLENALVSYYFLVFWHFVFTHAPPAKLSHRLLSSPLQAEGKYPFPLNNVYWKSIFPQ